MHMLTKLEIYIRAHMLLLIIYLFAHNCAAAPMNVTANEQYVAVMRSDEYVLSSGLIGQFPSIFIGLLHIAVLPPDPTAPPSTPYRISTTVWHDVGFATNISLMGYAKAGVNAPTNLPLIVLAGTSATSNVSACPIQGTYVITEQFLQNLRAGLVYAQIRTAQNTGNLRGQIYSRRDAMFAAMGLAPGSLDPQYGMSIFQIVVINGRSNYLLMNYWVVSLYRDGLVGATTGGTNYTPAAVFGQIPPAQTTYATLLIANATSTGPVVPYNLAITGYPLVGPGSTDLILTITTTSTFTVFSQLFRVAYYTDYLVLLNNGTGSPAIHAQPMSWGAMAMLTCAITMLINSHI
jgi:hypothetical protein